jgi:hypothetical protein
MEPESSLPSSQEPDIGLRPEPNESIVHRRTAFLQSFAVEAHLDNI